jgi:putative transposase
MGRPRKVRPNWNALATIGTISDEVWQVIAPILAELDPPKATGRPHGSMPDARSTPCSCACAAAATGRNQLPERFPDDSSVHRTFQRWVRLGVFERRWATLVQACDEVGGVDGEWPAADAAMGKARLGGIASGAIRPIRARGA